MYDPFKDMPAKEYLKEQEEDIASDYSDLMEVVESFESEEERITPHQSQPLFHQSRLIVYPNIPHKNHHFGLGLNPLQ